MNQRCHRVIFNRARGLWMAVRETASGQGRARATAAPAMAALALLLAAPGGFAQIIVDPSAPGRERPIVLRSANGTPTVQIQTPSPAGVSRNRYQQFDIGQQGERGAILNNSRASVQSQIGGRVPGNPWLANGSARVIVNQVQSAAQSRLAGTLEVAGQRADVIVANPAGLVVNGLSLLNAAGVTLTTGTPRYGANGGLDGFSVRGGAIELEGLGLDAAQANYAQVLARAITLNAGLWARDLRMVTGVNEIAADGQLQSAVNGTADKPQFALDVAHLGGMYARKITLIGTEAGLGVRNAGTLAAAAGPLTLSADGQLSNAGVIASQGAGAELGLSAKEIDNRGTLMAQRLDITAAHLQNAGQIIQTGPQALEISSLAVSNTGDKAVLGVPAAQGAAAEPAAEPAPAPSPAAAPVDGPAPSAPALAQAPPPRGRIHISQRLDNTGQLVANGPTDVKAIRSFVNSAPAHLRELHAEGLLDNRQGALRLQRLTGAQSSVFNAEGALSVATDLRLVAQNIDNTGGVLASAQSLSAEARTVTNDAGTLGANGDLTLKAQQLDNQRGARLLSHAGSVHLTIAEALNNQQGQITAAQGLYIDSGTLNNTAGAIDARQDLQIQSMGPVDNRQGVLQSGRDLSVRDTRVAAGAALDQATQTLSNQDGKLFAARAVHLRNQALTGAGRIDALGDLALELGQDLTHQGTMATNGKLRVETAGQLTNQGALQGSTGAEVIATRIDNQPGARISTGQNITAVRARQDITNRGLIDGQDTRIDAHAVNNIATGRIYGDHVSMAAQRLENRPDHADGIAPVIAARQDLDLGVPVVINEDGAALKSLGGMRLGGSLDANRQATGQGQELRNQGAWVDVQGHLRLDTRVVNNLNAELQTNPLADVQHLPVEDLISFPGKAPDSAALYRQVAPGTFVPFSARKARFSQEAPIPGSYSDGRMFKPVYPDKFLSTLPAAFIETRTAHKYGQDFPPDIHLQLEPEGSKRFADLGIALPQNYTATEPTPWKFGATLNDSGRVEWNHGSDRKGFEQAMAFYRASIEAAKKLHAKVLKVVENNNQTLDSSREYTRIFNARRTIFRDAVKKTKPARMEVGGNIKLTGQLNNLDSTFTAGGSIETEPHALVRNHATKGNLEIHTQGSAIRYKWEHSGGWNGSQKLTSGKSQPYTSTVAKTFDLPTVVFKEHHPREPVTAPDASPNTGSQAQRPTVREQGTKTDQIARTLEAGASVPLSALYVLHPENPNRPLVETDPAFTRGGEWTSSDELLDALDAPDASPLQSAPGEAIEAQPPDQQQFQQSAQQQQGQDRPLPGTRGTLGPRGQGTPYRDRLQKRLGDGFYEQQLVQQQIGQLTGRRFLGDYRSNDAQYQALLQSGVTFAKAHGLRPGVALSAAQMAQLTSDIVWLVEQPVKLPGGAVQTVLVPRVYVVARAGDLDAQGALISADQVVFDANEDIKNNATLFGRRLVKITARDIDNAAGHIVGKVVGLHARRDMHVEGGSVSATQALLAHAERDILGASTTRATPSGRNIDQVAAFALRPEPSSAEPASDAGGAVSASSPTTLHSAAPSGLHLSAGRDIDLKAVQITNAVEGSQTSVIAQRHVRLGTIDTAEQVSVTWDPKNHLFMRGGQEVGTQIYTRGLTQVLAKQDINARAAQVQTTGHLEVEALGNVRIDAGQATYALNDAYANKRSGFLSSSRSSLAHQVEASGTQASHFGGKTIDIRAGKDIDVIASNVVSEMDTSLNAKGNVNLLAAPETASQQSQQRSSRSGLFGGDGLGVTLGSQRQSTEQSVRRTASAPSHVGSTQGSVAITAGNAYRQIGSDVIAPQGHIDVTAKSIAIQGAQETQQGTTRSQFKQSGLSLALSSPVIGIAQTAKSLADAASQTSNTRMQALAAGAAALNVYNQRQALQDPGMRLDLSLGSRQSQSHRAYSSSSMRPSRVAAGGHVNLTATGAGKQSNLVIEDSHVHAGKVATLSADHQIRLLGTPETHSETTRQRSRGASLGLSLGAAGPALGASASKGQGHSQSDDLVHQQTSVSAGERVDFHSGGDTQIRNAGIYAPRITGFVGGKLNIESLQDTSSFDGRQGSASGSAALGPGYAAASAGHSQSRARGNYASVNQTSGIFAGDGGFDIDVKGNTHLEGGLIVSKQSAIDHQRNRFSTGTLTYGDIENRSDHQASGSNLSGGITTASGNQAKASGSDTVTHPERWSAQNQGKQGVNSAAFGFSSDQGSERSTTRSGISAGALTITDDAGQRALTGQSAAQAVAGIHRDVRTEDASQGLTKQWDGQRMLQEQTKNTEIMAAFEQQARQAIGDYGDKKQQEAKALRAQAETDPERAKQLKDQANKINDEWGEKGSMKLATHALVGAFSAGVPGAAGVVAGVLTGPAVAETLEKAGIDAGLSKTLTGIASTLAGAAVAGPSGAATAMNEVANNYLKHLDVVALSEKITGCQENDLACKNSVIKDASARSQKNNAELLACGANQECVQTHITEYVKGANSFKILHAAEKGKEKIAFGAMSDMQTKGGLLAANLSAGITGLSKWVAGNCVALTTAACNHKFQQAAVNEDILFIQRPIGNIQDALQNIDWTKGPHQYIDATKVCDHTQAGCTPAAVFDALRQRAAPGAKTDRKVFSGSVSDIKIIFDQLQFGHVTHLVDPETKSLVNITITKQHALYPGWVLRQVQTAPDGSIHINSYGTGTGPNPLNLNVLLATPLWGGNVYFEIKKILEEKINQ